MNCNKAKQINIFFYLKKQKFKVGKTTTKEAWFYSPFRNNEKTPSFKVDINKNIWYDFGEGVGGTIIDFIMKYNNCSIKEALAILSEDTFSFHQPLQKEKKEAEKIKIIEVNSLQHPALVNYLKSRKIPLNIAQQFCKEVRYQFSEKLFFTVGLKNKAGGWELRNKFFKNSSSPKDYSLIKNQSSILIVVEGMFDLLSLLTLNPTYINSRNLLILNSIHFMKSAELVFGNYERIELHLDRDEIGFKVTNKYVNEKKNIVDMSFLYKEFKDWNAYLVAI